MRCYVVHIQPGEPVLSYRHADHTALTRRHELLWITQIRNVYLPWKIQIVILHLPGNWESTISFCWFVRHETFFFKDTSEMNGTTLMLAYAPSTAWLGGGWHSRRPKYDATQGIVRHVVRWWHVPTLELLVLYYCALNSTHSQAVDDTQY